MIFRRIHADGFGVWRDLTLDSLSPGLNVFLAPNEGGKSTLMALIRAILFGFKRRGHPRRYEPLRGGRHGGHIDLVCSEGTFRIDRTEGDSSRGTATLTDESGRCLPEAKLANLLQRTTETLYENVFAFGLDELQRIDTLEDDEVAGHIYSAGMGHGAMSPVAFRAELVGASDALYRPRGKKQPIGRLMGEIEVEQERIEALRRRADEHGELVRRRDRLEARLAEHDRVLDERHTRVDTSLRARRAWPQYQTMLAAEARMRGLGIEPDDVARAGIRAATAAAGGSGDEAPGEGDGQLGVVVRERPSLADGERREGPPEAADLLSDDAARLLHQAGRIRGLTAAADRIRERADEVERRRREVDETDATLQHEIGNLSAEWTVERVRATRTDLSVREDIRRHLDARQRARAEVEATAARASDANVVFATVAESREQISRSTFVVCLVLIAVAIAATAIATPASVRLAGTTSVVSVGALLAVVIGWLYARGRRERLRERELAAHREQELWQLHDDAQAHADMLDEAWSDWLDEHGLPASLEADHALDLIEQVRQLQSRDRRVEAASEAVVEAVEAVRETGAAVVETLQEFDVAPLPALDEEPLQMVDRLLQGIERLQAELRDAEEQRARVGRVVDEHARARAALTALAGDEGLAEFVKRLGGLDPDTISRRLGEAQAALTAARSDRDAIAENLGAVREQIAQLEQSEELTAALSRRETLRACLEEALQEWATHTTAVTLYDQAKSKYEAERQPEVIRLASRYLSLMTHGRYRRVIAPLGESRLVVERAESGERLAPEALSRGTGEQLYLAMRLALAKVYGQEAVALPLVADDILVNFDDDRARATAALLQTFAAEGHQILAFTCHRHLVDTFVRHTPGARVQTLPAHA